MAGKKKKAVRSPQSADTTEAPQKFVYRSDDQRTQIEKRFEANLEFVLAANDGDLQKEFTRLGVSSIGLYAGYLLRVYFPRDYNCPYHGQSEVVFSPVILREEDKAKNENALNALWDKTIQQLCELPEENWRFAELQLSVHIINENPGNNVLHEILLRDHLRNGTVRNGNRFLFIATKPLG